MFPRMLMLCLWLVISLQGTTCEVFTSVLDLERVLNAENDIAAILSEYIEWERFRLDELEKVAQDYRDHSLRHLRDPDKSLGNLVSAFSTVKRFTTGWTDILQTYIHSNRSTKHVDALYGAAEGFPGTDDLKGAAASLLRLQDTYALEASEMAKGNFQGMESTDTLDANDCFEVGRLAYDQEDFYHACLWMEQALDEFDEEVNSTLDRGVLYDYLNFAYYQQGEITRARELVKDWLEIDPDNERAQNNLKHYSTMLEEDSENPDTPDQDNNERTGRKVPNVLRPRNDWQSQSTFFNYEALCRGDDVGLQNSIKHTLYCSYKSYHPLLYLAPLKEEILSFDPPIAVFHNILTEIEMAKIRELATPLLHRSGVFTTSERVDPFTSHRVSKTAWIKDHEDPLIRRVSIKSSLVSNLTLGTVEDLQVVNYGIGGQYEPHYDFSRSGESNSFGEGYGNRIATVIFYVGDVKAAGGTVFPDLGVRVEPEKGSCVVWFNLLRNGDGDFRTIHAGCPVLTGSKWIATKWFHETGQEFVRNCDLDPFK